jgi:hypothetical protein
LTEKAAELAISICPSRWPSECPLAAVAVREEDHADDALAA